MRFSLKKLVFCALVVFIQGCAAQSIVIKNVSGAAIEVAIVESTGTGKSSKMIINYGDYGKLKFEQELDDELWINGCRYELPPVLLGRALYIYTYSGVLIPSPV